MARQSLFSKACSFVTSGRLFAPNRYSLAYLKTVVPAAKDNVNIPAKPKKPLTPFFRFIQEHRKSVIEKNPELKVTEVIKKCSEDWKNVHATVKERYEQEYKGDMDGYAKEYLAYQAKLTDEMKEALRKAASEKKHAKSLRLLRRKQRETNKPKRPALPHMRYLMHQCEIRNLKLNEHLKDLIQEWNKLGESEKAKYVDLYEKDRTKYKSALLEWEKKMFKEGNTELVRKSTIESLESPVKKHMTKEGKTGLRKQVKTKTD